MAEKILGIAPFPFHLPLARELHLTLVQLYPSSKAALFAGQKAGVQIYRINGDQAPYLVWKELLELAANSGLTSALVQVAATDFPGGPKRPFLSVLLAGGEPEIPLEPRAADGKPGFRKNDDVGTEPEAFLFHDDLSLPTGRLPWLISVLERMASLVPAVCKLEVTCPVGIGSGTAFRISSDHLLTNWHVLHPEGTDPTAITATFGYEDDGQGGGMAGTVVPCDVASIESDQNDDWGIIRVSAPLAVEIPTILLPEAGVPAKHGSAFIIQHPQGQRKRVAYTRNRITYVDDRVVQYLTDTDVGSSGSPVFDEKGKLISLHHAGGRPQEVAGQPPLKKNEGIRIEVVLRGARAAGLRL